jgi:hypothetical protein
MAQDDALSLNKATLLYVALFYLAHLEGTDGHLFSGHHCSTASATRTDNQNHLLKPTRGGSGRDGKATQRLKSDRDILGVFLGTRKWRKEPWPRWGAQRASWQASAAVED